MLSSLQDSLDEERKQVRKDFHRVDKDSSTHIDHHPIERLEVHRKDVVSYVQEPFDFHIDARERSNSDSHVFHSEIKTLTTQLVASENRQH